MTVDWNDKRKYFESKLDNLTSDGTNGDIAISTKINDLNNKVATYINNRGSSNNNSRDTIDNDINAFENIKKKYSDLNKEIVTFVSDVGTSMNLSDKLTENGKLQQNIKKLEHQNNELNIDVESAIARDEILRSKDISRHDLFIMNRPIRRGLIPYLWVIGILFIGIGLVIFKMTIPVILLNNNLLTVIFTLKEFFTSKMVLGSLLISTFIVIIFLSLKIAGIFGK